MRFMARLFVTAFFALGSGFRLTQRLRHNASSGQPGQVDEVFNIGGPAVFTSGLANPRGGGCFPGIRMWTMRNAWYGTEVDYAPFLTIPLGYHHALQEGMEINRGEQTTLSRRPCSNSQTTDPTGIPVDIHSVGSDYVDPTQNENDHWYQVLNVGVRNHHNHNIDSVKASAARQGWSHVHSSFDEGGDVIISRQVSHLFRHPETRECIVTFQGADGWKDGIGHALAFPVDFCGLPTQVHMGFRDGLRHVLNNTDWQANIRSQFPTCSKVYAAGHSLGGMKATLFAACANQLLQPGDDGYDSDYRYITWTATTTTTTTTTMEPGPVIVGVQSWSGSDSNPPAGYLPEDTNDGFGFWSKYVYVKPRMELSAFGCAGFNFIQSGDFMRHDRGTGDLAEGAGGNYRYIVPVGTVPAELAVKRVWWQVGSGNNYGNCTGDINSGRGGRFLYFCWSN